MASPFSARLQLALLKAWHAWLAGGFMVAYLTAGEDSFAMHRFAGYTVLAAIALRLLAGLLVRAPGPLRLPRPSWQAAREWWAKGKGRHPLFAWLAAALLAGVGAVALSGAIADFVTWLEHPHEAMAELSLWLIVGHVAFVTWMYAGRRWLAPKRTAP
jgi:cytochrome b